MTSPTPTSMPYGPATASVRRFLVQLAALDLNAHDTVVARFNACLPTRPFHAAELELGEVVERSGRADARDALAGPLMQLVRQRDTDLDAATPNDAETSPNAIPLDPIAEPALSALLALLVRDLLPSASFNILYSAFDEVIPQESLFDSRPGE